MISHRGASGEELENSFAAFDLAIMYGTKWIELDCRTSADGTLWISHDSSTKKMSGEDRLFADLSDSQIANLRLKNCQRFHTLEETFERYGTSVSYMVEMKESGQSEELCRLLRLNPQLEVIVISFDHDELRRLHELNSSLRLGAQLHGRNQGVHGHRCRLLLHQLHCKGVQSREGPCCNCRPRPLQIYYRECGVTHCSPYG